MVKFATYKIRSPIDGYVARRNAQSRASRFQWAGTLMAVVSNEQMWLEANFKETQLTNMRIGQPVKIHFDLYGKIKEFDGVINGIEMGTGNAFLSYLHKMLQVTGLKWCNAYLCELN